MNNMETMGTPGTMGAPSSKGDTKIQKAIKSGSEVFLEYLAKGDEGRILEDDFIGVYTEEAIKHDKERVKKFKLSPEYVKPTPESIVLENIINEIGEAKQWLSSNSENESEYFSTRLSEYDDTMKDAARADILFEKEMPDGEVVRMIIDVTTSVDERKTLYEKKQKSTEKIENGVLHPIKYFRSRITDEIGLKFGFPMVIVGIDKKTLNELCERIARGDDLYNDIVSFMILDEIVAQLRTNSATSARENGENHSVTKKLYKITDFFQKLLEKKESLRPEKFREEAAKDGVYSYLS